MKANIINTMRHSRASSGIRLLSFTRPAQRVRFFPPRDGEMTKTYAGIPKPITMTHGTFATIDNDRNMPVVEDRRNADATIWDFSGDGRFFSPFPPSHVSWMPL